MYQLMQRAPNVNPLCINPHTHPWKKKTFLQLSALFSPKIAESRECGRIESVLADWIVFCSISGYIKRKKLWTYKKSDGCLLLMSEPACSWPQQKTGKAKKKRKTRWFTDQASESRGEDECHSTFTDSQRCKRRALTASASSFLSPWSSEGACGLAKLRRVIITCWESHDFVISYQIYFVPRLQFTVYSFSPH